MGTWEFWGMLWPWLVVIMILVICAALAALLVYVIVQVFRGVRDSAGLGADDADD